MNSPFATEPQRKAGPGPGALVVGRPRASAAVIWAFIGLIAIALVATGRAGGLVFGVPMLPVFALGVASLARSRVWVDGPSSTTAACGGCARPCGWTACAARSCRRSGATSGRQLQLLDADGTDLTIDATNLRLAPLYEALADFIPWD